MKLTAAERRTRAHGKDCDHCGDVFDPRNGYQRFCSPECAERAKADAEESRWEAVCELDGCENSAGWDGTGRARRYCSDAHRKKAWRQRKPAT
jgi:hypothetical protein